MATPETSCRNCSARPSTEGPPTTAAPALAESLAAADGLTGTRRLLAYADIAERLGADDAPWVAYGNNVSRDFFSARIGCVTYQPVYGIDLGALCIRKGPRP